MAELTREVSRELRLDSYGESGVYFCWVQPPKTNESVDEESVWEGREEKEIRNKESNRREVAIIAMLSGKGGDG